MIIFPKKKYQNETNITPNHGNEFESAVHKMSPFVHALSSKRFIEFIKYSDDIG